MIRETHLQAARWTQALAVGIAILLWAAGCGVRQYNDVPSENVLLLEFGKRGTEEIVGYYFAGFLEPPGDPFEVGLVARTGRGFRVRLDTLSSCSPWLAEEIAAAAGEDRRLDWDEFSEFVSVRHARIRNQPVLSELLEQTQDVDGDWMRVDVTGVMSTLRRRVSVRRSNVFDALRSYEENGRRLVFPVGTRFVGQHLDRSAGTVLETTVMTKREDGQWDFFVYDSDGVAADSTLPFPRALSVPTQCVGCHFGSKLYEPEKSFPSVAPDGPHGPRRIHVPESLRDRETVAYFDEHRRRSDHVLGLYGTLLAAELRHARQAGTIDADADSLLTVLGL